MLANFPAHWFFITDSVIGSVHEKIICSGYTVYCGCKHNGFIECWQYMETETKIQTLKVKDILLSVGIISEFNFILKGNNEVCKFEISFY